MDIDIHSHAPETKAGVAGSAIATHDDVMRIFETYKAENDAQLAAAARGRPDVLQEEKLARLDAELDSQKRRLDEITLKGTRPPLGRDNAPLSHDAREHKSAFDTYVRRGETANLRQLELKALSVGSNPDGGYTVPVEIEREIGRRLTAISPIRGIAGQREISGNVYKKPFMITGPSVGWVGETAARPQTDTPTLDALSFPAMELYAMPAATAALLEDSAVNIDEWLAAEVEQAFAVQEGAAFVSGDGVNKPKGFLAYDTVANASWEWAKLGYIATGEAGAWPLTDPSDVLIDLVYAVKAGYRQNGMFVMNRKTQAAVRKFKDEGGREPVKLPAHAQKRAARLHGRAASFMSPRNAAPSHLAYHACLSFTMPGWSTGA